MKSRDFSIAVEMYMCNYHALASVTSPFLVWVWHVGGGRGGEKETSVTAMEPGNIDVTLPTDGQETS